MTRYKTIVLPAAWIPADNSQKRTKGQWHQWFEEQFCFFNQVIISLFN